MIPLNAVMIYGYSARSDFKAEVKASSIIKGGRRDSV